MVDFVSPAKRANIMRGSRSNNTKPELRVRRLLHSLGYRYRLHVPGLPGRPDIAFLARQKAIFVHGCFWHQHDSSTCSIVRRPSSNTGFWNEKFKRNKSRDDLNRLEFEKMGWEVLTIWECEAGQAGLGQRLADFLGSNRVT